MDPYNFLSWKKKTAVSRNCVQMLYHSPLLAHPTPHSLTASFHVSVNKKLFPLYLLIRLQVQDDTMIQKQSLKGYNFH